MRMFIVLLLFLNYVAAQHVRYATARLVQQQTSSEPNAFLHQHVCTQYVSLQIMLHLFCTGAPLVLDSHTLEDGQQLRVSYTTGHVSCLQRIWSRSCSKGGQIVKLKSTRPQKFFWRRRDGVVEPARHPR